MRDVGITYWPAEFVGKRAPVVGSVIGFVKIPLRWSAVGVIPVWVLPMTLLDSLHADEKEKLVAVFIEMIRNKDRSADGAAENILSDKEEHRG